MPQETIFQPDEMEIRQCQKQWTIETLLSQQGLFYFKDIAKRLRLRTPVIQMLHSQALKEDKDPWVTYGIGKVWTHWLIKMPYFAPHYPSLAPVYQELPERIDSNTLLAIKGIFLLKKVCKYLPLSDHQIKDKARTANNPAKNLGVWKDPKTKKYLVNMEIFADWIKRTWQNPSTLESR